MPVNEASSAGLAKAQVAARQQNGVDALGHADDTLRVRHAGRRPSVSRLQLCDERRNLRLQCGDCLSLDERRRASCWLASGSSSGQTTTHRVGLTDG